LQVQLIAARLVVVHSPAIYATSFTQRIQLMAHRERIRDKIIQAQRGRNSKGGKQRGRESACAGRGERLAVSEGTAWARECLRW